MSDERAWALGDVDGRPVEVTAAGGFVFVCDALDSPYNLVGLRLTGAQALVLAGAVDEASAALRVGDRGRCWRLEDASGVRFRVTTSGGVIRILGEGGWWPDPPSPRVVVGGVPEAVAWVRALVRAARVVSEDGSAVSRRRVAGGRAGDDERGA
jgi:hypothetical protein